MSKLLRLPRVIAAILLTLIWIAAMPIWVPFAVAADARDRRRLRRAARSFACPACGRTVGDDGLRRADAACRAEVSELMRANPGVRLRLHRTLHAICPGCGAEYEFDRKARSFRPRAAVVVEPRGGKGLGKGRA